MLKDWLPVLVKHVLSRVQTVIDRMHVVSFVYGASCLISFFSFFNITLKVTLWFYLRLWRYRTDLVCFVRSNPSNLRGKVNPYNGRPFTDRYFDILKKRIDLPVWEYREEFMETVKRNKILALVGETGSGKTTQVK